MIRCELAMEIGIPGELAMLPLQDAVLFIPAQA